MTEILYVELALTGLKAINATFDALRARNDAEARAEGLRLMRQVGETLKNQTDWIMSHPQPERPVSVVERPIDATETGGAV